MDPHSRHNQFNLRAPKAGPLQPSRHMEAPHARTPLAAYTSNKQSQKSPASDSPSSLIRRPIATNSRVKKDEKYRNEMYLSFVTSALQEKANVCHTITGLDSRSRSIYRAAPNASMSWSVNSMPRTCALHPLRNFGRSSKCSHTWFRVLSAHTLHWSRLSSGCPGQYSTLRLSNRTLS